MGLRTDASEVLDPLNRTKMVFVGFIKREIFQVPLYPRKDRRIAPLSLFTDRRLYVLIMCQPVRLDLQILRVALIASHPGIIGVVQRAVGEEHCMDESPLSWSQRTHMRPQVIVCRY